VLILYRVKQPKGTGLLAGKLLTIGAILGIVSVVALATQADASSTTASGTPLQILSEAQRATLAARSVTLTEHLVSNGVSLTTKLQGRWPNRIRVSVKSDGFDETIILTSSSIYVKENAKAWKSEYKLSASGVAELANRWFVTNRSDPELGSTSLSTLDPKVVERPLFEDLEKGAPDLQEQSADFDGRPAIKLWDATGAVYVASTGRPYILQIVSELPSSHGFLDFSAFNRSTKFSLPHGASNLDAALAQAQSASGS
jgi:hypothetical protein